MDINSILSPKGNVALGRVLTMLAGSIALLILAGWSVESITLVQISVEWPPFVPLAVVGMFLLALSVFAQSFTNRWLIWVGRVSAGTAGLIGIWVLLEYFLNVSPKIDFLLWKDSVNQLMVGLPGRPAPQEAWILIFAAIGYGLLKVEGRYPRVLSVSFMIASWVVPVMVITGYVYDALALYILRGDTGTALMAAISFLIVGAGAAFIRTDRPPLSWILQSLERPTILRLIFVAVMVPLVYRLVEVISIQLGMNMEAADATALLATASGIVIGVLSIGRSERKAAALLREEKERFSIAFEDAPVGMSVLSKDGIIIEGNFSLSRITGWKQSDLDGLSIWDILWEPDYPFVEEPMSNLMSETIAQFRVDVRLLTAEKEPIWVDLHMAAVHDGDGNFSYILLQALDLTDRKKVERYLAHQATHDPLTGLPNRAKLEEYLANANNEDDESTMSLVFFDLNYFKEVNDTYGHDVGDEVLIEVAARLMRAVRAADFVARLGGDEFVMVVQNDDANDLLMDRLRTAVEGAFPINGYIIDVKVSIGIAPLIDGDYKRSIAAADRAMYEDKLRLRF